MHSTDEPIAIIGSACRFPGHSNSASALWSLLQQPRDILRAFDPEHLNLGRFYHANGETHGSTDVQAKSYLLEEDTRLFDANFFAINPVEAAGMDPQQRLLLEAAYEACEDAGVTLEQLKGSLTSVHVGVMSNDYATIQYRDTETLPKYNATGTANSILSNRVSYMLDLKGPSVTVDTACSSSLVALHYAVQGLRNGDSDLAIVGGTNLILDPLPFIAESKLHMLSPDSRSRMWDKSANGYARGEGIAALLLKPLSAAQRDGDAISAIIRATGVNSDGASQGITMPFAAAQTHLIRTVYRRAGLDPIQDAPQYVECHGTGTQAGDPVEARAVFDAFYRDEKTGRAREDAATIHVGSVKTVIGHLEGCAGLAGVIKVLLALKHRSIPPNMHFSELNPKIAPHYGPGALVIPTTLLPWPQPRPGSPMRASINSFGFGGTNAHAILESPPEMSTKDQSPTCSGVFGPLLFSANSGPALWRNVRSHLEHIQTHADIDVRDLGWVSQTRRSTHRVRTYFTGATRQHVVDAMSRFVTSHEASATQGSGGGDIGSVARLVNPKEASGILGIFTGQGAQWARMGYTLYEASPLFRASLDACEAVLKHDLVPGDAPEWSLVEELGKEASVSRLSEAALAQPLCTAVQIGLVDMLHAAGIELAAVVGHSSGEIAATYAAGIITARAAMQIAYYRGRFAHVCRGLGGQKGGMMAVGLSMDAALRFCSQTAYNGRLVVAASNGPQSCTLSGDVDAIDEAKQQLDSDKTFARKLLVDTAYHSHHMQGCVDQYLQALLACDIQVAPPKPGCVWNSSVRGDTRLLDGDLASLKGPYWIANMVQTVKFSQAVESSIWHGGPWDLALEIGPHAALKGPTEQTLKAAFGAVPQYASLLRRDAHDVEAVQAAVGHIWAQLGPGHVDFAGYRNSFYESSPPLCRMIAGLPAYSWDHGTLHWRESRTSMRYRTMRQAGHELLGRRVPDDNQRELRWRNLLRLAEMPWLRGHDVLGAVLLPAAAYVSIAAQAAQEVAADILPNAAPVRQLAVENVDILRPVVVPDNTDGVETLFTVQVLPSAATTAAANEARPPLRAHFSYYACQDEATGTMVHTCSGTLVIHFAHARDSACPLPQRQSLPDALVPIHGEPIYDMFRHMSLNYTGAFHAITESRRCLDYAAATAVWPPHSPIAASVSQYVVHPAVLDVAFQSLFVAHMHPAVQQAKSPLLPSHIERVIIDPHVTLANTADMTCNLDAWVVAATRASLTGDINLYHDVSGRAFVQVEGISARAADGGQSASLDKHVFWKTVYGHDVSVGGLRVPPLAPTSHALEQNLPSHLVSTDHAIGQLLKQITFKFPRCKLLDIGNGTGSTSTAQSILHAIDNMYESYTYTDVSSNLLPKAAAALAKFDRVAYKTLDIHQDMHSQGFESSSYDVIIAPHVLSAISTAGRLDEILAKVRSLMRPGGYLVLSQQTGSQNTPNSFQSSGAPPLSPGEWHKQLRLSGFSGADTVVHDNDDETRHMHSYIVTRAVNDDFLRLVQPLASAPTFSGPLVIIGGHRLYSSKVIDEMRNLLPATWWQSDLIRVIPSIDELTRDDLQGSAIDVMCLQDMDEALFARLPISKARLEKLQLLLMSAKNLLWVTGAGTSHAPRASMILGIARVVPVEMPHLTLQVLGIEIEASAGPVAHARYCVEALLRLRYAEKPRTKALEPQSGSGSVLWTVEPEVEMLANGTVRIQRLMLDVELNEQYNAKSRTIVRTVDATNAIVRTVVPKESSKMQLQAVNQDLSLSSLDPGMGMQVHVNVSMHIPSFSHSSQGLYLVYGQQVAKQPGQQGHTVMAVSDINASRLLSESDTLIDVGPKPFSSRTLQTVADKLLRFALVSQVQAYAAPKAVVALTVLLIEPEQHTAEKIRSELTQKGHQVYCVSLKNDVDSPAGWVRIHANMSRRMVQQCFPSSNIDLLVNCSMGPRNNGTGKEQLLGYLPVARETWNFDAELLRDALRKSGGSLTTLFEDSGINITDVDNIGQTDCDCSIRAASELNGADATNLAYQRYITDWSQRQALPLTVQPLDAHLLGLLRPDRTYLLVGSSSGLGISLCRWMLNQGAKHIVVTSRNPKGNVELKEEANRVGASLHFLAMDVTLRDQVTAVVDDIRRTMPPIAGVCNLAMVLNDKMFLDMSAEQLNSALEAKVVGTEILDELFSNNNAHPPLDFFIVTSSLASVVGNIGQANYHAANLFMVNIVERRRARGLTGSVIHIGWIADTGYVARSDKARQLADHFRSIRFIPLSETDVQDAFAQAIHASRPRPSSDSEFRCIPDTYDITMGLELPTEPMQDNQINKALWVSNPRLMALEPYSTLSGSSPQQRPGDRALSGSNVREQVCSAETEQAAAVLVAAAFAAKLETMLQLPAASVQTDLERPVIDFGLDSLIATEIRTWFLQDLDIDVDVFSILGGDTVMQISMQAAKSLWSGGGGEGNEIRKDGGVDIPASAPIVPVDPVSSSQSSNDGCSEGGASSVEAEAESNEPSSRSEDSENSASTEADDHDVIISKLSGLEDSQDEVADRSKEADTAPPVCTREAPMSAAQSRIWFVSKHHEDPAAENNALHYHIQGHLNTARLVHALQILADRHEGLRTCFYARPEDGHPMQGVMATSTFELTVIGTEETPVDANEYDVTLQDTISRFKSRIWDLEHGRTMAIALLRRSATEHDMVIGYHHILMDGWSVSLFLRDVDQAYRMQPFDTVSPVSYIDYSLHQLDEEKSGSLDADIAFWRAEFDTLPDTLPLLPMTRRLERSAATRQDSGSHYADQWLSQTQLEAQKDLCKRLRITPFHLHLALLQALLARLSGAEDICVGVVDANRRDKRFRGTVGCFVNMLPLRCSVPNTTTFAQLAMQASQKVLDIFSHGNVPFDRILDSVRVPRTSGVNPLFQAAINYRSTVGNIDILNLPLGDECRMQLSAREVKEAESPYDVSLGFLETPTGCLVQVWCLANLYDQSACHTLLQSYLRLLEVVAQEPHVRLADVVFHDGNAVSHALEVGKGVEMDFGWPATLSQRVQDMCLRYPTATAITDTLGMKLSYAKLASKISFVAQNMGHAGARPGTRVAVLCEPSADSVVAILAALGTGCVYIPLDVSLPAARHTDMMHSCRPTLLLCHVQTKGRAQELLATFSDVQTIQIDAAADNDTQTETSIPPVVASPDSPAICLFTSGSTGKPKGILLTQANFINHVALKTHQMGLQQEIVLQQSSFGFDMSLIQVFSALANGGHLVVAGKDARRDPVELANLISSERVSMTIATPTEYLAWINSAADVLRGDLAWRFAFSGGERIPRLLRTELRRLGLQNLSLTNCYGPTEITAAATFQSISLESEVDSESSCLASSDLGVWSQYAVGKALPNYSLCIIDAAGHAQPTGNTGEICIGGSGVALGYLDQSDQTKDKFVQVIMGASPRSRTEVSRLMYRTGDKGRLLSDGTLLFLGRLDGDTQVKLRGQRIELQEVEMALLRASEGALVSVVVSLRGDVLVAHGTLSSLGLEESRNVSQSDMAQQILNRVRLPQAFIPAILCILDTMPKTPNGKLDRKSIAALPLENAKKDTSGGLKDMEKMTVREGELRLLWERVLPTLVDVRLGPSSDFFMYGGNSMLLMKLQKAIKETTGIHVSTKHLYESSTLRAMTHCVFDRANHADDDAAPIDWAVETSLPASLQSQIQELSTGPSPEVVGSSTDGTEVLLTGATSFLGSHLMHHLLSSPCVKKIHCVAVPADEQINLSQHDTRIACYSGTLLSPTLGLTPQERRTLEQSVHVIVHAGAHGHCLNRFDSLRAPNLHSLHFLASLALPLCVPILFLSSSRVVLLSRDTAPKPGSMRDYPPAVDGKDGYTASKWAGEVFLENLVAHLENMSSASGVWSPLLNVEVHRACTLVSDSAPNSDAMNAILRYSLDMRCAPRLKRAEGYLDFAPMERIVDRIAEHALEMAAQQQQHAGGLPTKRAEISFRHHSGGIKSAMGDFKTHLERMYGGVFDEVDMEEWVVRAGQRGMDPLIVAYIEALLDADLPITGAYMGTE